MPVLVSCNSFRILALVNACPYLRPAAKQFYQAPRAFFSQSMTVTSSRSASPEKRDNELSGSVKTQADNLIEKKSIPHEQRTAVDPRQNRIYDVNISRIENRYENIRLLRLSILGTSNLELNNESSTPSEHACAAEQRIATSIHEANICPHS